MTILLVTRYTFSCNKKRICISETFCTIISALPKSIKLFMHCTRLYCCTLYPCSCTSEFLRPYVHIYTFYISSIISRYYFIPMFSFLSSFCVRSYLYQTVRKINRIDSFEHFPEFEAGWYSSARSTIIQRISSEYKYLIARYITVVCV